MERMMVLRLMNADAETGSKQRTAIRAFVLTTSLVLGKVRSRILSV